MNPDLLKLIAIVVGATISAPFVLASIRAFFFFGQMSEAVKTVQGEVKAIKQIMEDFTAEVRIAISDHEARIMVMESERRHTGRDR